MNYEVIDMHTRQGENHGDGSLSFIEAEHDLPFDIKRIYYIYDAEQGVQRGRHAHKLNKQLMYCPYGKIEIFVDDGENKASIILDEPSKGLILYPGVWRDMVWLQKDSVLCVAASEFYDADEYIRDYEQFLAYVRHKKGAK